MTESIRSVLALAMRSSILDKYEIVSYENTIMKLIRSKLVPPVNEKGRRVSLMETPPFQPLSVLFSNLKSC